MQKVCTLAISAFLTFFTLAAANALEYRFASPEEASAILAGDDNYFERMSAAEIAIRMESQSADKSIADIRAQYAENVRAWSGEEMAQYEAVLDVSWDRLESVAHLLPEVIYLIRSTSKVEGGLPHTRANAIIIPENNSEFTSGLLFHETFHVLTRNQPARHAGLYGLIGFKACEMNEPEAVASIHLTNPDVPEMGWYLPAGGEEGAYNIVPFLYAAFPAFNPEAEHGFPGHFAFGLLKVEVNDGVCTPALDAAGAPVLLNPGEVPEFFAAIGQNTGYIIHPEEVLADNFTFLMTGKQDLPNPEIPERLEVWLMDGKPAQ